MYQTLDVEAAHSASAPSPLLSIAELPRTLFEAGALAQWWPLLTQPRGDGHPVLVLPGFTAGDLSTAPLRRLLERLGYLALPWLAGRNTGSVQVQRRAFQRFDQVRETQGQPVSLVGQSLGGVFAREIARRRPRDARCVITLGSPFGATHGREVNALTRQLFRHLSGRSPTAARRSTDLSAPLDCPATAIYSRTDGVVAWQACLEQDAPLGENVEVFGSHSGMGVNPAVLHVIADRLAQRPGAWQRFDRSAGWRAWAYPEPRYPA